MVNLAKGMALATAKDEKAKRDENSAQHSIAVVYHNPTKASVKIVEIMSVLGTPRLVMLADADITGSENVLILADLEGPLFATRRRLGLLVSNT